MLENILNMYIIEFDYTDYTRCIAVSIMTAFKIQNSASVEGMHNRIKKIDQYLRMLRPRQSKLSSLLWFSKGTLK